MKAYDLTTCEAAESLHLLAEAALERYNLQGARCEPLDAESDLLVVEVPQEGARFHPYLGRIDGKRFVLRVYGPAARREMIASELLELAARLRDTDDALPEPVPACDGALVPAIHSAGAAEPRLCALFRGVDTAGCMAGDLFRLAY